MSKPELIYASSDLSFATLTYSYGNQIYSLKLKE